MFDSLLIANRGEIACRVIRTARRMGLRCVAVYSEADAEALHVELADEARLIGPAPAAESYLDAEAILAAARDSSAGAIHPGYGFLSENAAFAEACAAAGLIFVGPPPAAIRAMGSKSEAKALMEKAGVPTVPGYHGTDQDEKTLADQAEKIGYPLLIKASAGGGGKGMRLVERSGDFAAALAAARRESAAAFGDDRVLLERYLTKPRHIEVQVFADGTGNTVHLFERDCSIQRRHQKVLEEAPAVGLSAAQRDRMGKAAVAAAEAVGYVGAGTVEFIAESKQFYFMEMNTRLQVEHPVTEMITGQDLVEWQLRVASGEALPCRQKDLAIRGHAIEARIYAEDPARDFLPATGRLDHLRFPESGPNLRVDGGVRAGDEVTVHYDPMIAKLIVWDEDRPATLRRLRAALAETQVAGLTTNLAFLAAVADHPAYGAGDLATDFVARHEEALFTPRAAPQDDVLALASLAVLEQRRADAEAQARRSGDPHSPWHLTTGWRLNVETQGRLDFLVEGVPLSVTLRYRDGGYRLDLPSRSDVAARGRLRSDGELQAELAGRGLRATVVRRGRALTLFAEGAGHELELYDPLAATTGAETGGGRLTAPMPGKVIQVHVEPGARIERGAPLLVLEAMKMEHAIVAPGAAVVAEVRYGVGELVEEGAELLVLELEEA